MLHIRWRQIPSPSKPTNHILNNLAATNCFVRKYFFLCALEGLQIVKAFRYELFLNQVSNNIF